MSGTALVAGASGITGRAVVNELLRQNFNVIGLARRPPAESRPGVTWLAADLLQEDTLKEQLSTVSPSKVFINTWLMQESEPENIRVNAGMVRSLLASLDHAPVDHVSLTTGLKHYLGPFETWGTPGMAAAAFPTPFREEQGRLPIENFYYNQEDEVFAFCEKKGCHWSVHRPSTVLGFAVGNAMNMASTLAVYANICKKTGQPFLFPGQPAAYRAIVDATDSRILAQQCVWAATTPDAQNQAFNTVNGDNFRWEYMWNEIASYFGLTAAPYPEIATPLEEQMENAGPVWQEIAEEHGLVESDLSRIASFWHSDLDMGRPMDILTDMSKSRQIGFHPHYSTKHSFFYYFEQMKKANVIPQ